MVIIHSLLKDPISLDSKNTVSLSPLSFKKTQQQKLTTRKFNVNNSCKSCSDYCKSFGKATLTLMQIIWQNNSYLIKLAWIQTKTSSIHAIFHMWT